HQQLLPSTKVNLIHVALLREVKHNLHPTLPKYIHLPNSIRVSCTDCKKTLDGIVCECRDFSRNTEPCYLRTVSATRAAPNATAPATDLIVHVEIAVRQQVREVVVQVV